jgi:hypothetical protein
VHISPSRKKGLKEQRFEERKRFHETEKQAAEEAQRKLSNRKVASETFHVLALYSSPTSVRLANGRVYKIPPQQQLNLTKEMRSLVFNGIPGANMRSCMTCIHISYTQKKWF